MTENELYEEYCNEYPLIMGYREVSYESWLQRQVLELRENVVNKNCNIPRVSNSVCPHFNACQNGGKNEYCDLQTFNEIDCFVGQTER